MNVYTEQNGVVGDGVPFERIRRITGYLVGTLRAEVQDRVKHDIQKGVVK